VAESFRAALTGFGECTSRLALRTTGFSLTVYETVRYSRLLMA